MYGICDLQKGFTRGNVIGSDCRRLAIIFDGMLFDTGAASEEKWGKTILREFVRMGTSAFANLCGNFAFALWDSRGSRNKLYIVRDPLGVKQLMYAVHFPDCIAFATNYNELFGECGVKGEIDSGTYREIFGFGPARSPESGVYKNVRSVAPGGYVRFNEKEHGYRSAKYFELQECEHTDTYDETRDKVRELVQSSVKRQLQTCAAEPGMLCSFLSGGIDSSIVTAIAAREPGGEKLPTYSFDFAGNDEHFIEGANTLQPERDRPFIDSMLRRYPTLRHCYLECPPHDLADYLFKSVDIKGLPGMADIDASLLYFCEGVEEKYALTGECADELFGGYPWFAQKADTSRAWLHPWSRNLDFRTFFLSAEFRDELDIPAFAAQRSEVFRPTSGSEHQRLMRLTIDWFMQTLLTRMDNAAVGANIVALSPFADVRLCEYLYNVPHEFKAHGGVVKGLLRDAFADLLPRELLTRKKSPFPKTYNPAYTQILCERLRELLRDSSSPLLPLLDSKRLSEFIDTPQLADIPWYGQLMNAPQMLAYLLQVDYWLRKQS